MNTSAEKQRQLLVRPVGIDLQAPGPSRAPPDNTQEIRGLQLDWPFVVLLVCVSIFALAFVTSGYKVLTNDVQNAKVELPVGRIGDVGKVSAPKPALAALPLPQTGIIANSPLVVAEGAPFHLVTPTGNQHYFAKVVESLSGKAAAEIFVRGGEELTIYLSPGTYRLRYAQGRTWYGPEAHFGPETHYAMTNRDMVLTETPRGYEGVTIELISQVGGNLRSIDIDSRTF